MKIVNKEEFYKFIQRNTTTLWHTTIGNMINYYIGGKKVAMSDKSIDSYKII